LPEHAALLPIDEAQARLLALLPTLPEETVEVEAALGRGPVETVLARRTLPPWDNSAMDGFAVRRGDLTGGEVELPVVRTVHAGDPSGPPLPAGAAVRIMTGAPLPPGADAVVKQEDTSAPSEGRVRFPASAASVGFVRRRGEEVREGAPLIPAGTGLGLAEAGLLWAQGILEVRVPRRPKVALISTGDELCRPDEAPLGRIVDTNLPVLAAALRRAGAEVVFTGHAPDEPERVRALLEQAATADLVLSTAGVSVGARDHVRPCLEAMGVALDFWRVALKPGKPLVVGRRGQTVFLGLPGNPTSALVTFELFVRPALRRMLGHERPFPTPVPGRLDGRYTKPAGLTHLVRVATAFREGALWATPLRTQSSGTLASSAGATHLMKVPSDVCSLDEGAPVELAPLEWRW